MLENGATTIWECWDRQHSQIHDTLISIGSWFVQGISGIRIDEGYPGFRHFLIRPAVVGDLTWAKTSFSSVYGEILVDWKLEGSDLRMDITVPANTTATVYVPARDSSDVMEGGISAVEANGLQFVKFEDNMAVYLADSGKYSFTSRMLP